MNHLNGLNERQKEAVLHTEGPLLIVAGAGAGKTKTITHRIVNLISEGVPGRAILAVTFTNKAAGEMRDRVRNLLPASSGGLPLLTTFHSFGVRTLREFHDRANIPRRFDIWDRDDSQRAVKNALEKIGIGELPPRYVLSAISRQKGNAITRAEYAERAKNFQERAVSRVWELYDQTLDDEGALDFDDLLLRTLLLLRNSPETLSLLRERYTHITVDEYQDTNRIQYEIVRLLAGERRNICVVGDIDQNIYSWRGADIEHLMNFEETFPGTKVVLLEENYRSTRTILAAANSIISKNQRRRPKNLFTENETGDPLAVYGAQNEVDEVWFVAHMAQHLIETGTKPREIAVLYRENFQSRTLEEAFLHFGIPYRVLGTRFFERKEVKDTLSYLRAALNPKNKIDIGRVIAVPPRGIGKVTLDKMLAGKDAELASGARSKVQTFRELMLKIRHALDTLPASEAVRYVVEASGMEAMYKNDPEEGRERLENIRELVNLATRYDFASPPEGIEQLLEEAALQSEQDGLEKDRDQVSLMTVHASKGLEFDAVFITGMEQGLFPSTREDESRDSEEERRLFYVALTRARKRVFLSYATSRMRWGSREFTIPSEFLEDIDARLLKHVTAPDQSQEEDSIE